MFRQATHLLSNYTLFLIVVNRPVTRESVSERCLLHKFLIKKQSLERIPGYTVFF